MQALRNHIATVLLLVVACAGCTDKDRELAKRTGDGSDTLKFKEPRDDATSTKLVPPPASVPGRPLKQRDLSAKDGDGSETFKFKQDPRTLPKTTKSGEK